MNETDPALLTALTRFDPTRFGLEPYRHGWVREFDGIGRVAFARITWPHTQLATADGINAVQLAVLLQQETWGFPPEEAVPVNVLTTVHDTGGDLLAAYSLEQGWNLDGWKGFAIGMGSRDGVLYSHMLGVHQALRGSRAIGWFLKVLQGWLALRSGHQAMTWTFDPMRGANARLNAEKLGASMIHFTIDKYGIMQSALYGSVPTDRLTAYWKLTDPAVHDRLDLVATGNHHSIRPRDLVHLPEATIDNAAELRFTQPASVRYRIPGDIDLLMKEDPQRAVQWRQEMREVLGTLMTCRSADFDPDAIAEGPIGVTEKSEPGPYEITGFATDRGEETDHSGFYLLTLKE